MLWNSDTASLMSKNKPLRKLEDMKGLKIRTPSAAQSAQLEALGATPIDMPVTQIYNNLDRGVIDASMIPMSAALDFKLIEVAKYYTVEAPLGRSPFVVALNKSRYEKLPAELKRSSTTPPDQSQPQRRGDIRQEEQGIAGGRQEGPRSDPAPGAGAPALARRVQADDPEKGRGRRESGHPRPRPGRRLRPAQLRSRKGLQPARGGRFGADNEVRAPEPTVRGHPALDGARRRLGAHAAHGLHRSRCGAPLRIQSAVQGIPGDHRVRDVVIVFLGIAYCGWLGGHVAVDILERPLEIRGCASFR